MTTSTTPPTTWFVTGCSGGFGRELVLALLARNHPVVATARRLESIKDLEAQGAVIAQWDVTDSLDSLKEKAKEIDEKVGGVAVLVNNAGFVRNGPIECTTPEDDQSIFATNVFGLLNTTRAFLPFMRERKTGTIVNISSIAGLMGHGGAGLYNATKFAVEGITESLSQELSLFNLRAISIAPGMFRTALLAPRPTSTHPALPAYAPLLEPLNAFIAASNGKQQGDPKKAVNIMIDVALGEGAAEGREMPKRLLLGPDCVSALEGVEEARKKSLVEWKEVGLSTDFEEEK